MSWFFSSLCSIPTPLVCFPLLSHRVLFLYCSDQGHHTILYWALGYQSQELLCIEIVSAFTDFFNFFVCFLRSQSFDLIYRFPASSGSSFDKWRKSAIHGLSNWRVHLCWKHEPLITSSLLDATFMSLSRCYVAIWNCIWTLLQECCFLYFRELFEGNPIITDSKNLFKKRRGSKVDPCGTPHTKRDTTEGRDILGFSKCKCRFNIGRSQRWMKISQLYSKESRSVPIINGNLVRNFVCIAQ